MAHKDTQLPDDITRGMEHIPCAMLTGRYQVDIFPPALMGSRANNAFLSVNCVLFFAIR
jgi:hypothetical protein